MLLFTEPSMPLINAGFAKKERILIRTVNVSKVKQTIAKLTMMAVPDASFAKKDTRLIAWTGNAIRTMWKDAF